MQIERPTYLFNGEGVTETALFGIDASYVYGDEYNGWDATVSLLSVSLVGAGAVEMPRHDIVTVFGANRVRQIEASIEQELTHNGWKPE